jgi:hypothetical protein
MPRDGRWQVFVAGAFCGAILIAVVGGASLWWTSRPARTPEDDAIYDGCLIRLSGNTVACDALLRTLARERAALPGIEERERIAEESLKKGAAKLLAAGFSKREVVEWATKKGFVGSQLSDAVGISLGDLRAGKY